VTTCIHFGCGKKDAQALRGLKILCILETMAMFGARPVHVGGKWTTVAVYRRLGRARSAIHTEIALPLLPSIVASDAFI